MTDNRRDELDGIRGTVLGEQHIGTLKRTENDSGECLGQGNGIIKVAGRESVLTRLGSEPACSLEGRDGAQGVLLLLLKATAASAIFLFSSSACVAGVDLTYCLDGLKLGKGSVGGLILPAGNVVDQRGEVGRLKKLIEGD